MQLSSLPNNILNVVPNVPPPKPAIGAIMVDSITGKFMMFNGNTWGEINHFPRWNVIKVLENGYYIIETNDREIIEWLKSQPAEEWNANWYDDKYELSPNLFSYFKLKFED